MEIDHKIFSKVILLLSTVVLSLLRIQEGQLSVSFEKVCTILVNSLEDSIFKFRTTLFIYFMANNADPDQLASSEAN